MAKQVTTKHSLTGTLAKRFMEDYRIRKSGHKPLYLHSCIQLNVST